MTVVRLLGVPIDSVGGPIGTTFMPRVLREQGVVEALGAEDLGDLDVLIEPPVRDPETGIVGSDSVLEVTPTVRAAIARHVDPDAKTIVLGGCCCRRGRPPARPVRRGRARLRRRPPRPVLRLRRPRRARRGVFTNDAPVPGGIDWPELRDLLGPLVHDPACLGISIACYNPERDPERESARRIVGLLREVV